MKTMIVFAVAILLAGTGTTRAADPNEFWKYYEQHPDLQDFYPFGVYGGFSGQWSPFGHSPKAFNELLEDTIADAGFNSEWGGCLGRILEKGAPDAPIVLNAFGKWYFGEEAAFHEFRNLVAMTDWTRYNQPPFAKFQRQDPLLSDAETNEVETGLRRPLTFARQLAADYPQTILGFVSDDEPNHLAPAIAAIRLLEKYTGRPVTTCIPSWGAFQVFTPHMQPITGDWYPTNDLSRDSWSVAANLRWLQKNQPDRVFYFLPLASAYHGGHEPTRPWLPDSRPSRTELRAQFWMAVAGGCKGFYYYNPGWWIDWAGGEDNLLNMLLQPNNDLWAELRDLGRIIAPAGPLLNSCRPDPSVPLTVACGTVRYPEFEGPAMEANVLRDIRHDRFFLVPWNNDIDRPANGRLVVPGSLATGRKLFDLADLAEVPLDNGADVTVQLPPGGGRLLLLTSPAEFALCRETVLRHRVRLPRVQAKMRYRLALRARELDLTSADQQLLAAQDAEKARKWTDAETAYRNVVAAIDGAEQKTPYLPAARKALERVVRILSETDDLFRTSWRLFDLPRESNYIRGGHFPNKFVGKEIRDWCAYTNMYFDALFRFRQGDLGGWGLHDQTLVLEELVSRNRDTVKAAIDRRLTETRKPVTVAYVTPDRTTMDYVLTYSWAYENCRITWIAPAPAGGLADENGVRFDPAAYQVIWIDQLRYAQPPPAGQLPQPQNSLPPALLVPETAAAIGAAVQNGSGLLLTGVAGLYVCPLGLEKTTPDRVRENSFMQQGFSVGLAAADGYAKHPIFNGLDPAGFFLNANYFHGNLVSECAWEKTVPEGRVVANELDDVFGRIAEYAAVVEYPWKKGKVLVLGGRAVDQTPMGVKDEHYTKVRDRVRQVTLNAILYGGTPGSFQPDTPIPARPKSAPGEKPLLLPSEGWQFHTDPGNVGVKEQWFRPDLDVRDWKPIRIAASWESQGYDYNGFAWYRLSFPLANRAGRKTMLHFGAVDEEATVYIDGRLAGAHNEGKTGWDKPFSLDITSFLTDEERPHQITVQVFDSMAAGGIWKAVYVRHE